MLPLFLPLYCCFLLLLFSCIVQDSFCFGRYDSIRSTNHPIHSSNRKTLNYGRSLLGGNRNTHRKDQRVFAPSQLQSSSKSTGQESTMVVASSSKKDLLARLLGYVMGAGAMFIYTPILIKLLQQGSAEGFSVATWWYNLVGFSMAIAYPARKGFPISTYLEIIGAAIQSIGILGLICYYESKLTEFAIGVAAIGISFVAFEKIQNIPPNILGFVQIAASLLANYANVPQIILTFQSKKASWSGITALLSVTGCLIRIFTTIQLTKDPFVIAGFLLGAVTNGLLLAQVLWYR